MPRQLERSSGFYPLWDPFDTDPKATLRDLSKRLGRPRGNSSIIMPRACLTESCCVAVGTQLSPTPAGPIASCGRRCNRRFSDPFIARLESHRD